MTSPRALVAAVVAFLVATVLPWWQPMAADAAARAATGAPATPLTVELTQLTPSTFPAKGRIVLAGTVRNDSTEIWSAINVQPFLSATPITSRDDLAEAAASDPASEVGTRLTHAGQFAAIGDLAPGQSASFRISLKAKELLGRGVVSGASGVYWIGVHALGQTAAGRQLGGRARTFIPLVAPSAHTSVALVVPVRERVRHDAVGRLVDTSDWATLLGDEGRLERLAALLDTAGGVPTTMLLDPAVVDAVGSIAADDPPLSFGKGPAQGPSASPSPGTPTPSRSANRLDPVDRQNAARWLAQMKSASDLQTVLGLGYADPDTTALARHRPQLIGTAAKQSAAAFKRLGITALPAVAPPSGWLDDAALSSVPVGTMVLVSDHAAPRTRTHWRTPEGQDLIFADAQAASGGPGPTAPLDALAVRQRIISEAALRAQDGPRSPMVVELPATWDPGPGWQAADFFGGLEVPWLELASLDAASVGSTPTFDAALGYPAAERRAEVRPANVAAARSLVSTATVLGQLLRSTNDVKHGLIGIALEAVSLHARHDQGSARSGVLETNTTMRGRLNKVSVVGTDFVTLSGGSGIVTVTLVNQLDQPITVGIQPRATSPDVRIDVPEPRMLAAGQRTVLKLHTTASAIGVHEVTLTPVTAAGAALGKPLTFSVRTSQVGKLIWAVLIGGGVLLLVMILRRIRRGLREHRWRGQ